MSLPPSRIRLLDSATVNQIAAGEVIENAASVVKELIENALDAGADEISIETLGGGRGQIIVRDNGAGMDQEEVPVAIQRHATSKISQFTDIFSLSSFGFRGEALPAIASISKMEIHTARSSGLGSKTLVEKGEPISCETCPRQPGTTISVHSLFYNVPVRQSFQKSLQMDRLAIRRLLENSILSTDNIGWTWISERRQELSVAKKQGFTERVALVMGEAFVKEAFFVDKRKNELQLIGFLGAPNIHRSTRQGQRLFINNRAVESSSISKKIAEAYSWMLPAQRYPVFVLKLFVPSQWCDFNVHPQKTEVRLLQEGKIGALLVEAISETLLHRSPALETSEPRKSSTVESWNIKEPLFEPERVSTLLSSPVFQEQDPQQTALLECSHNKQEQVSCPVKEKVRFLASLGKILLVEDSEGVHAIFVQAARKHLFYSSLMVERADTRFVCQTFLLPPSIQVTKLEADFLQTRLEDFAAIGIDLCRISPDSFAVESAPAFIQEDELKDWLVALAQEGAFQVIESFEQLVKNTVQKLVLSRNVRTFDYSWLDLLWQMGKPEKAFDGETIRRLVLDDDFM
ncbi:DNA mismatch repair endonuclease MutL [Chlamydia sp.]|uniref:DNA mismatch repair endonuclease MutL n=1 Tax=Chlamydia sp. TaxID=35827 RepID=UPI0025C69ED0|nr:DNA mismatch repair endonuclease MutL [Chlamydia sp.]MBQ8498930.1 DNA mismatch repair endonuclease MutL [Chlamydia sp.]